MLFALLVLASAFMIEGIGTYISVVGLSLMFAGSPVIITLMIALDIGKVVTVSFLYKQWKNLHWIMKSYMTVAAIVLMMITSTGAFGFLSGEFQRAIAGTNQDSVLLTSLSDEQDRLQHRKEEIDKQVAQLPDTNVRGRTQLMRQFGPEVKRINDRLAAIDVDLPKLKVASIKKNVEVGPIIYIAEAFNTTPEHAVKWVILTIIFVFDPLAVALLLAGNYLIELLKNPREMKRDEFGLPQSVIPPMPEVLEPHVLNRLDSGPEQYQAANPIQSIWDMDQAKEPEVVFDTEAIGAFTWPIIQDETNIELPPETISLVPDEVIEVFTSPAVEMQEQDHVPEDVYFSSPPSPPDHVITWTPEDEARLDLAINTRNEKRNAQQAIIPGIEIAPGLAPIVAEAPLGYEVIWAPEDETRLDLAINTHYGNESLGKVEEAIVDVPLHKEIINQEEAPREVVTLEQVTKPKVARSSLEDVDDKLGDVETDEEIRTQLRVLRAAYRDRDTADSAVAVGGPSDRFHY